MEQFNKLLEDVAAIKSRVQEANNKMSSIINEVNQLKEENEELKNQLKIVKKKKGGEQRDDRIKELEQYSRRDNVLVTGIPWQKGENTQTLTIQLGEKLGVPIQDHGISTSHRLPSRSNVQAFIVRFNNRDRRDELICALKKMRLNTNIIGIEPNQPIYCDEHLTVQNIATLRKAKQLKRAGSLIFIWTKEGTVYIKIKAEDERSYKITNIDQLDWQQNTITENDMMDLRDDQSETSEAVWSQKEEGAMQKRKIEDISLNMNNQIRENRKKLQLNQSNAI